MTSPECVVTEVSPVAPDSMASSASSSTYRIAADVVRLPRKVPDWHEHGACRQFPELDTPEFNAWHDAKRGSAQELAAKSICAGCPVRLNCATSALERGEPWGIWGGLDRADRKAVAKRFGFPPPGDPPEHGTNSRRVKWGCPCPECKAAHALYESERRRRALVKRRAQSVVVRLAPVAAVHPVRLDLDAYRRRTRRRTRRSR